MASSSSAPIPPKYDVFLSFRGEDTRYSFTYYLYDALRRAGIETFRDDDEIRHGEELAPKIKKSIKASRASVIVLSENYAKSTWCLEELWLIMEQKRECKHMVFPVFYKVDPSDVRKHRGSFSMEEGSKWTIENVNKWKKALTEVADLKACVHSCTTTTYEKDFIEEVVCNVNRQLGLEQHPIISIPTDLIGMVSRVQDFESWLRSERPVMAICGMGGSGKTTLAKHIYNSNKRHFESSSICEEVENHRDGLLGVQKKLLKDISRNDSLISDVCEGALQLKRVIQMNKVLIVLDDMDDQDKLTTLVGEVFPTRSKIIITTRHQNIDTWFGSISYGCLVYNIKLLDKCESLELLSHHAFGSKVPMIGFEELAGQLALYCEGHPLALKLLGSSLYVRAQDGNKKIKSWKDKLNSLNSFKGSLDDKVDRVLKKSFESLQYDTSRLFLDIACFFVGVEKDTLEIILEDDYGANSSIDTLVNRCLITIHSGYLGMHKLLQDMARLEVRKENNDPAKRSRVWHHDESYHLLKNELGSKKIEGLALNMLKLKDDMHMKETIKISALKKMTKLKYLELRFVNLIGSYEDFPDLIWLIWNGSNLKTIPRDLSMSSLVALDMSYSLLVEFEMPEVLNSLKCLEFICCPDLVSIRNLYHLPKLVKLIIVTCINLTYVCKSIGELENLSSLYLAECPQLVKGSFTCEGMQEQPLCSLPQSLRTWVLTSYPLLETMCCVDLKMLHKLVLNNCTSLKSLPCLPTTLKVLKVNWCTSLKTIKFQSARFTLEEIGYKSCFKLCEIEGLFKLVSVEELGEADLGHMQWVKPYEKHKVDLVGDVIAKGRTWNIQMLYEYGIRSIFLQGIKDQSMATHEYTSSSKILEFDVPFHPKKHRIKELTLTIVFIPSGDINTRYPPVVEVKIYRNNTNKGASWRYVPVVYCKPEVDNEYVWSSYWPIGDMLDVGDTICIYGSIEKMAYGASLVYIDDGEVEKEETCESMKGELEVIGGDLSFFEVKPGEYNLCRPDRIGISDPATLRFISGDNSKYNDDSRRWRIYQESDSSDDEEIIIYWSNPNHYLLEYEFGVSFNDEIEIEKIEKAVLSIEGVDSVSIYKEISRLNVCGCFEPLDVIRRVREFKLLIEPLLKRYQFPVDSDTE